MAAVLLDTLSHMASVQTGVEAEAENAASKHHGVQVVRDDTHSSVRLEPTRRSQREKVVLTEKFDLLSGFTGLDILRSQGMEVEESRKGFNVFFRWGRNIKPP